VLTVEIANAESGKRAVYEKGVDEEDCAGDGVGRGVVGNGTGDVGEMDLCGIELREVECFDSILHGNTILLPLVVSSGEQQCISKHKRTLYSYSYSYTEKV
jgi:hypothetical protein